MCNVNIDRDHPGKLIDFLIKYNNLALDHQIQAATRGDFKSLPNSWITWANKTDNRWKEVVNTYASREFLQTDSDMPVDLLQFIQLSAFTPLHRTPFYIPEEEAPARVHGVSPKKLHEVYTMSCYITSLFAARVKKPVIVDIGAGQGYLSRALASSPSKFHVLALDSDDNQTTGSMNRQDWTSTSITETTDNTNTSNGVESGSLTHKTIFIDSKSLNKAIEEWIEHDLPQWNRSPLPVVLVGLHCCGDLTPSILQFIKKSIGMPSNFFEIVGCVIVGCCYNRCSPISFPLSKGVSIDLSGRSQLSLETQHLHLATQSPLTWDLTQPVGSFISSPAALAVRKVTYRSLLARRLPALCRPEDDAPSCSDVDWRQKRVGRLRSTAYKDFPTYLHVAKGKLGLDAKPLETRSGVVEKEYDLSSDLNLEEKLLSRTLEVLYVLRCLLGPAIESLIAADRYLFLQEAVEGQVRTNRDGNITASDGILDMHSSGSKEAVKLVNLFDQSTGSLRNLALTWVR